MILSNVWLLTAMFLAGCRYAQHERGGERLNVGDGVTAIRYFEFGMPGDVEDYLAIDIPKKSLYYETGCYLWAASRGSQCYTPEIKAKFSHVCTDAEWLSVVSNLNAMAVSEWEKRYDNNSILDGSFWCLELCNGTNVVRKCSGANAWPKNFHYLGAINGFVRKHPAFVAAYPKIAEEDRESKEWFEKFCASCEIQRKVDSGVGTNSTSAVQRKNEKQ